MLLVTELCLGQVSVIYDKPELHAHTVPTVAKALYQICKGVSSIHSIGVTHRDLKIENLLIGSDGNVKICDFGSATTEKWNPDSDWTHNQRCLLEEEIQQATTPMYRTPEVLDLYSNFPINEKQDCWAIGCLVYILCFKTHPFIDGQKLGIIHGRYRIPDSTSPFEKFPAVIKKIMVQDPRYRPSASQIASLLENEFSSEVSSGALLNPAQMDALRSRIPQQVSIFSVYFTKVENFTNRL